MALGRAFSVAVRGLDGETVEIEADITSGLPGVHLVGLPDAALQESRDRVRAAVTNCGNSWPMARLTLALSPATLPKVGSVYDIALAAAVLSAQRRNPWDGWRRQCCWVSWRWTAGFGRCAGCCRPCWPPNATAGPRLSFRWTTWPRPAWSTESTCGASARCAQLQGWLNGAAGLDERITDAAAGAGAGGGSGRRGGPDPGAFRGRGGGCRGASPHADGPTGSGQNDAGATSSGIAAAAVGHRVAGGHRDSFGGRPAVG